jgi:hypothetical protein
VNAVKASDPLAVPTPVVLSIDPRAAAFGWPAPFPDSTYLVATSHTEGALKIFPWNTADQKFNPAAAAPAIPREMQTGDGQIVKGGAGETVLVYSQVIAAALPSRKIRLGAYAIGENVFRAGTRNEVAEVPGAPNQRAPFMLASGLVLYFAATPEADSPRDAKIYKATRTNSAQPFSDISVVDDLNVATAATLPTWVSEDECRILFTSNREGNYRIYERRHRRPGT